MPKISDLTAATSVGATDVIPIVQSGTTKKLTATTLTGFAKTAAETSGGITPSNYGYPPGDVRRYGAVGDGSTDDTTALQAALTVSRSHPMYLPPASSFYKITSALSIPGTGAVVIGSGYNSIIRQATASAHGFTVSGGANLYNLVLRDVYMGVSGNITGGTAFYLEGVSQSMFSNCAVIADSTAQGFLKGFHCYTANDSTAYSILNEFFGCKVRTAVSASARGYLLDGASTCSSNSHRIFGGEVRADSGKGIYVPDNGGGSNGVSTNVVITGVSFEGATEQAVHIDGSNSVDQGCYVSACRFEGVTNGVLFDAGSQGNAAIGNFYTSGLTGKAVDRGEFNAVIEPSATAGGVIALTRGSFRGQLPYTGSSAIFEGRTDNVVRVVVGGNVTGDTENRIAVKAAGQMEWGSGSASADVVLSREGSGFVAFTSGTLALKDGMTAPGTTSGYAKIYVDSADGDLKVKFGDGTVKTIVVDT